ncbi:MAG TPA: class I SAM-dependent methyltransferase [Pyrinomonadaceae bacterium]|nr:class I SAM-dependent methyltransferase [Pyrinomonadaceae bacterium]
MNSDPTRRFSNRVEDYIKYRPDYPRAVVGLLEDECGLTRESVVADVGSGTGILSELFLSAGVRVYGVEPNREMREAGASLLSAYEGFVSVDGRAEETTLADASVDFVTAGQAFHWFDPAHARREFGRVLKGGGWAVLVWNDRRTEGTPLLAEYERLLLEYGTDYKEVRGKWAEGESIKALFGASEVRTKTFDNEQVLDFDGLKGRLMSASYAPVPGHPNHGPLMRALAALFERHQRDGRVVIEYDTKVFYGRLT